MCCTCLQACLFLFSVCLLVLLVILTLPLKRKVPISGKTEVNYGLSLPVIWKEIPPSSQIFAGICGTQSRDDLFRHSEWEQSSRYSLNDSNGKWSVFYCLKNKNGDHLVLCLTSLAKLKRMCNQFARKTPPRISNAKLGNNPDSRFVVDRVSF